jgi:hypothetical protein
MCGVSDTKVVKVDVGGSSEATVVVVEVLDWSERARSCEAVVWKAGAWERRVVAFAIVGRADGAGVD